MVEIYHDWIFSTHPPTPHPEHQKACLFTTRFGGYHAELQLTAATPYSTAIRRCYTERISLYPTPPNKKNKVQGIWEKLPS
jgi:hypothetical protein